jgi:MFS family permease
MLPVSAHLSDRFGRRRLVTTGVVLMIVTSCVVFPALDTRQPVLSVAAVALLWCAHSVAYGPSAAWISELFPTSARYGGVSIGYQLAFTLGAGLFPLVASGLLVAAGGVPHFWLVLVYVIIACVSTLIGTRLARETAHDSFVEIDARAPGRMLPEGVGA